MDDIKTMFKAILEPVFEMAVNNAKKDEKIENEDVDKRKLIDEVAGIMKSAGCDDELIRTVCRVRLYAPTYRHCEEQTSRAHSAAAKNKQ